MESAALGRPRTNSAPKRLVKVFGGRPADVLAAWALAAVEPFVLRRVDDPLQTAPKALDVHALGIGGRS
jgi:hypothetical protein